MPANLRKDFDDFLFAPVGQDFDGTPLTLVTVLARLGIDPWEEAAEIASLAHEPAMQRLASRLEAIPNRPSSCQVTKLVAGKWRVPDRTNRRPLVPQIWWRPPRRKASRGGHTQCKDCLFHRRFSRTPPYRRSPPNPWT